MEKEWCLETEEEDLRECVGERVVFGDRGDKPERVFWRKSGVRRQRR